MGKWTDKKIIKINLKDGSVKKKKLEKMSVTEAVRKECP